MVSSSRSNFRLKDHEGGGAGKILQWNGESWDIVSKGLGGVPDREVLLPLIYERAAAYAKEKNLSFARVAVTPGARPHGNGGGRALISISHHDHREVRCDQLRGYSRNPSSGRRSRSRLQSCDPSTSGRVAHRAQRRDRLASGCEWGWKIDDAQVDIEPHCFGRGSDTEAGRSAGAARRSWGQTPQGWSRVVSFRFSKAVACFPS